MLKTVNLHIYLGIGYDSGRVLSPENHDYSSNYGRWVVDGHHVQGYKYLFVYPKGKRKRGLLAIHVIVRPKRPLFFFSFGQTGTYGPVQGRWGDGCDVIEGLQSRG